MVVALTRPAGEHSIVVEPRLRHALLVASCVRCLDNFDSTIHRVGDSLPVNHMVKSF
jgi:hypothetical protein